jgi:uncharacterized membrane protein YpjA
MMHNSNADGARKINNNGLFFMGGATIGAVSAYLLTKYAYRNVWNDLKAAIARQVNDLTEYKRESTQREQKAQNNMNALRIMLEKASREIYFNQQELELLHARILSTVKQKQGMRTWRE